MVSKRALLIGCNYPGTKSELKGCINDVNRVKDLLLHRFGFQESDIIVMIDTDPNEIQPTGANIRKGLSKIVSDTESGDLLFVHYSGHGVRVPPESGKEDDTGYDECIVPTDLNLISDDDFRDIVNKIPGGVMLTLVSDSCHSGGLIEKLKEQIGTSTKGSTSSSSSATSVATRGIDLSHERKRDFEREGHGDQDHHSHHSQGYGGIPSYGPPPPHGGFPPPPFGHPSGFHPPPPPFGGPHGGFEFEGPYSHPPPHHSHHSGSHENQGYYSGYPAPGSYTSPERHSTPSEGSKKHGGKIKDRSLPIGVLTQLLSEKVGKHVDVGNIRTTLFSMFGSDASPMVKTFMGLMLAQAPTIISKLKEKTGGGQASAMLDMVQNFVSEYIEGQSDQQSVIEEDPVISGVQTGAIPHQAGYAGSKSTSGPSDNGILISGCQSDETSADASTGTTAYGALSNAIVNVLSHHPGKITNRELVLACRQMLEEQGYVQHPCLYCDDDFVDRPYICS